jgi:hypothetical protein
MAGTRQEQRSDALKEAIDASYCVGQIKTKVQMLQEEIRVIESSAQLSDDELQIVAQQIQRGLTIHLEGMEKSIARHQARSSHMQQELMTELAILRGTNVPIDHSPDLESAKKAMQHRFDRIALIAASLNALPQDADDVATVLVRATQEEMQGLEKLSKELSVGNLREALKKLNADEDYKKNIHEDLEFHKEYEKEYMTRGYKAWQALSEAEQATLTADDDIKLEVKEEVWKKTTSQFEQGRALHLLSHPKEALQNELDLAIAQLYLEHYMLAQAADEVDKVGRRIPLEECRVAPEQPFTSVVAGSAIPTAVQQPVPPSTGSTPIPIPGAPGTPQPSAEMPVTVGQPDHVVPPEADQQTAQQVADWLHQHGADHTDEEWIALWIKLAGEVNRYHKHLNQQKPHQDLATQSILRRKQQVVGEFNQALLHADPMSEKHLLDKAKKAKEGIARFLFVITKEGGLQNVEQVFERHRYRSFLSTIASTVSDFLARFIGFKLNVTGDWFFKRGIEKTMNQYHIAPPAQQTPPKRHS